MNSSLCLYVICIMLWLAVACQGIQCPLEVVVDFASLAHLCILVETLHSSHVMSLVISYMVHFCVTFILVINLGCSVCSIPSTSLFLMWKTLAFFFNLKTQSLFPLWFPVIWSVYLVTLTWLSCMIFLVLSDSYQIASTRSVQQAFGMLLMHAI